ncbi:hypothetical protein Tsubulata_001085 [Turnera subulata]|uniref:CCHC-type domain-containing protein n=1 Tax=Turnera subulata TaxID=218843 RepID=A0A9Q0J9J4_9ROSI|nr:hypothetical protein Tsubulata_001085 [Turnera subulata]
MQRLWGPRGGFRIIDLDHNYYLVKLADGHDYLQVMTGGPWVILDHYLIVEPWQPNFDPAAHRVTSVVAWVRKIERGRFAKVAVEFDISKPLETETYVDGVWYPIKYESLPQVCFSCGRAGHLLAHCPAGVPTSVPSGESGGLPTGSTQMAAAPRPPVVNTEGAVGGPAMVPNPKQERHKGLQKGSRFDVLVEDSSVDEPLPEPSSVKQKGVAASMVSSKGDVGASSSKTVPLAVVSGPASGTAGVSNSKKGVFVSGSSGAVEDGNVSAVK